MKQDDSIPEDLASMCAKDGRLYNQMYCQSSVAKADSQVEEWELDNLLGIHQRMMAARREAALADATVSLFQRLMEPELASAYDATYGRPVDEDARVTYELGRENHNPTSRMAGPMTWNTHRR
jgi:hypothetical protein